MKPFIRSTALLLLYLSLVGVMASDARQPLSSARNVGTASTSKEPTAVAVSRVNAPAPSPVLGVYNRPTVALALSGGGVRGAAHIGVIKVLREAGIPIDYIAGSSMGAIIGGLYSAGVPLDQIETELEDHTMQKAYGPTLIPKIMCVPFVKLRGILASKNAPYAGIVSGNKFRKFIEDQVPESKRRIEDLRDPAFCAVATNLLDGQTYRFTRGDLSQAIAASSALPGLVRPVSIDGNLYVDGGIKDNLPTYAARQSGADIVIAVLADEKLKKIDARRFKSYRMLANRVTSIIDDAIDAHHTGVADLTISPPVTGIVILSKNPQDVTKAVEAGEEAARESLPAIKALLEKEQVKYANRPGVSTAKK